MKDDYSYIDNITGEKLRSFVLNPKTNWEAFNLKFNKSINSSFFSNIGGFFTTKTIVVTVVVILSIFTAGIIYTENNPDKIDSIKGKKPTIKDQKSIQFVDFISVQDSTEMISSNSEDIVLVKVEIPIHKKVIIIKEVLLEDTINVKDSVKIE